ncbi:hypothetical protein PQX77_012054 [Marasmius sp. AFHP31]|nr:hypothetical protein PQX77_012054 [Marasmius sp. AFHP31]
MDVDAEQDDKRKAEESAEQGEGNVSLSKSARSIWQLDLALPAPTTIIDKLPTADSDEKRRQTAKPSVLYLQSTITVSLSFIRAERPH